MRNAFVIAAFLAFVAGGAMAQTGTSPPPAQNGPQNSAINSSTKAVEVARQGAQQLHRRRSEIADRESRIFEYQRAEEGR